MQKKPFLIPPKLCFICGFAIPILFGGMFTPTPLEYQTIANALVASASAGVCAILVFWFALRQRPKAIFALFCAILGNILGATVFSLFQGFDASFVVVRMIASLILLGLAYQHFVKKIKK